MFKYVMLIVAIAGGVGMTIQTGVNTQLRTHVQGPILSALISLAGGTVALAVVLALGLLGRGKFSAIPHAPWWTLVGGLIGAFIVVMSIVVAPRIGVTTLAAALIFGQLVTAIVVDHFGLIGFHRIPLSFTRIAGVVLLLGGVLLVQRR